MDARRKVKVGDSFSACNNVRQQPHETFQEYNILPQPLLHKVYFGLSHRPSQAGHICSNPNRTLFPVRLCSSSRRFASNSLLGGSFGNLDGSQGSGFVVKNWLFRAESAVPRAWGSIDKRVSTSAKAAEGKSLKILPKPFLYGCCGLNLAACGNFNFLYNSSEGDPYNLKILCICSTSVLSGKIGVQTNNSANMQSALHISIPTP